MYFMPDIGYKVVNIGLSEYEISDNPVVLVMAIPEDATIIKCKSKGYYTCIRRTNKVIPVGYYLPTLDINKTIYNFGNAKYEYGMDIMQYRDEDYFSKYNINTRPIFRSRYCYCYDKKPLIYKLDSLLEIDVTELDTNENILCSSGINYFDSYQETIAFLNYNK